MAAVSLLDEGPVTRRAAVREGLEGNLCRCTGYHNIVQAVLRRRRARWPGMTAAEPAPTPTVVGHPDALRKEDPGCSPARPASSTTSYIPGALWLAMVRSPHAHARIGSIDAQRGARACRAFATCLTGADLPRTWAAPMPCAWPVTEDMKDPTHFPLAVDKACYVGDIVAVVVADSRYEAADAGRRGRRRLRPAARRRRPRGRRGRPAS